MTGPAGPPIDEGLRRRFAEAGRRISWRPGDGPGGSGAERIAHLHDEEARVVVDPSGGAAEIVVDPGPVGALVLLLEIERRGAAPQLESVPARRLPRFPDGAIRARWGPPGPPSPAAPTVEDLVALARFALR
ncbi:MAG: hypothetical protein QXG65_02010 [Thermoplasmata archaeon]